MFTGARQIIQMSSASLHCQSMKSNTHFHYLCVCVCVFEGTEMGRYCCLSKAEVATDRLELNHLSIQNLNATTF